MSLTQLHPLSTAFVCVVACLLLFAVCTIYSPIAVAGEKKKADDDRQRSTRRGRKTTETMMAAKRVIL